MFKILSEIHTTTKQTIKGGKTITVHEPDWEISNADQDTMGVKQIKIHSKMSPEDKRAFKLIQDNVTQYKKSLRSKGETDLADAIPDKIATPPEFVFACWAYTFRKTPDSTDELVRTLGAMSAIKGRNEYYQMDPQHIEDLVAHSSTRLASNIQRLLTAKHQTIRDETNLDQALSNIAITSNFYWLNNFKPNSVKFPPNTVLAPLGSSAGLVGKFAKNLSETTGAKIVHDAFIKSNAPVVSSYTQTEDDVELRLGTDFLDELLKSDYGGYQVSTVLDEVLHFLRAYIGISNFNGITSKTVNSAINNLSDDKKRKILKDFTVPTGEKYNTQEKQIRGYYNRLLKQLRIAITKDYDAYNESIRISLKQILDLKNDTSISQDAKKARRLELIKKIKDNKKELRTIPLPNLASGGDEHIASYDKFRKLVSSVHKYINELDIKSSDDDTAIKKLMDSITKNKGFAEELQSLYLIKNAKLFKFSGAQATAGGDFNKGFSRFQLLNLDVAKTLHGKNIVIVDDNISSGGTIRDAVVSLYANGVVPLSILVVAPHLLSNTAAKYNPDTAGVSKEDWVKQRNAAVKDIEAGDADYRKKAIKKIHDEVTLNSSNPDALKRLADLAIDIVTDNTSFSHIINARKILINPFMYDNFIDTVVSMGKAKNAYGDWYTTHFEEISRAKEEAEQLKAARRKQAEEDRVSAENRAIQKDKKLDKARIEVPAIETLDDKIANLEKLRARANADVNLTKLLPEIDSKLLFLNVMNAQEKGGYVLPDMKNQYERIRKFLGAKDYAAANKISRQLEKEIKAKKQ